MLQPTLPDPIDGAIAAEIVPGPATAPVLLLCDHASNAIPPPYGDLGLPDGALARHIAYDIGAGPLTRALARRLTAPAILTRFSRLLIDPNRGRDDPTLVMRLSDGAIVAGNACVDEAEIERRYVRFCAPYDRAIAVELERLGVPKRPVSIVSIHSFTPVWRGLPRPWHVGILHGGSEPFATALCAALAEDGAFVVGENEPYRGGLPGDTIDRHATARGLSNALIEVRQDLIADEAGVNAWADRLAQALARLLTTPKGTLAPARDRC